MAGDALDTSYHAPVAQHRRTRKVRAGVVPSDFGDLTGATPDEVEEGLQTLLHDSEPVASPRMRIAFWCALLFGLACIGGIAYLVIH